MHCPSVTKFSRSASPTRCSPQDRIRILKTPPWIFAPLNLVKTDQGTSWAEAMTARPVMGIDGLLTIALGEGTNYRVLPKITGFVGIISALFKRLSDDNIEIVASTIKAIYDQTCRSCGLINRLIIYMPSDGETSARCALITEWATPQPSRSCCALTSGILRTKVLSQTRDKRTRLPVPARSGTIARGGNLQIGPPRRVPGAGIGSLGASGRERGASGQVKQDSHRWLGQPFSHSVPTFFLTRGRQPCVARVKSMLRLGLSASSAIAHLSLNVPAEGTS